MHFFYPFIVIEVIQICLKDTQITKQTTQKAQNPISVWRISIVRISGFQHRAQTYTSKDEGDERSDKFLNRKRTSIFLSSVTIPCTSVGHRGSISLSSVTTPCTFVGQRGSIYLSSVATPCTFVGQSLYMSSVTNFRTFVGQKGSIYLISVTTLVPL